MSYNKNNESTILEDFAKEVMNGLCKKRKKLNPTLFYDQKGSELF